jgi:hypothetical protein
VCGVAVILLGDYPVKFEGCCGGNAGIDEKYALAIFQIDDVFDL